MPNETHIFYVDDDQDDLELFLDAIDRPGLKTHVYDTGDKLLEALLNPPPTPAIVFLDLNMPIMSGYDLLKEISQNAALKHIPRVVLSTGSDGTSIERAREAGANYYITKPASMSKLRRAVEDVMAIDWSEHDSKEDFYYQSDNNLQ